LEAEEIFARFFLIAFLNSPSPLLRNAQKRDKRKSNKTTGGKKKKNGGKKSRIFCDEPRWIFRVFELPLLRNAPKTPLKKVDKK
jgi:hypothetical protein